MSEQQFVPFSQSPIWAIQRQYFQLKGIDAWRDEEVPFYVTNNPVFAKAYAELVYGFLLDRSRMNKSITGQVYILELGAGSGRFAFQFLTQLSWLCDRNAAELPAFCYILSDMAEANVNFWRNHPSLQPMVEKGILDMGLFDAEQDDGLLLQFSGKSIRPKSLAEPVIVIANYVFDSIPQDLFYFQDGRSYECRVNVQMEEQGSLSPAEQLKSAQLNCHYERLDTAEYYDNDHYNDLLRYYSRHIDDSHVFVPYTGLRCLERIREFSREGMLFVTADKGAHDLEQLASRQPPKLLHHGSFSLAVNYHAFKLFYEQLGGEVLTASHQHYTLDICCGLVLSDPSDYRETRLAYERSVERFGPDDFFCMKKHFEKQIASMGFAQLMAYLRFSGYDTGWFKQCLPRILTILSACTSREKEDLRMAIRQVAEGYYPLGEAEDIWFDCGILLYDMGHYDEALVCFQRALASCTVLAPVYYNIAVCFFLLGDDKAREYVDRALQLSPEHEGALALKAQISAGNRL